MAFTNSLGKNLLKRRQRKVSKLAGLHTMFCTRQQFKKRSGKNISAVTWYIFIPLSSGAYNLLPPLFRRKNNFHLVIVLLDPFQLNCRFFLLPL